MAHRILVLSPLHTMGATFVSIMMAQSVTYAGRNSMLLFTDLDSPIPDYLGIEDIDDPTRSISQVVQLINAGSMQNQDIVEYGHMFAKNAYLMNTADSGLTDRLRFQTVEHIYNRVTTDVVICDCSESVDSPEARELISVSEMIFIVIDMSPKSVLWFKSWMKDPGLQEVQNNVFVMLNKYDEGAFALRDFAKKLGFPANKVCKMHYNPWVIKTCFNGKLHEVLPLSQTLDYRVACFKNDTEEFNQAVEGDILLKSKKGL